MENFLLYIGKSALAAGAFYLVYLALFQNQKQFTFNRIYLPVSLAVSFIIPLITFTTINYVQPVPMESNPNPVFIDSLEPVANQQQQFNWDWYHYLFAIYLAGSALFLVRLLLGHLKALHIIRKSRVQQLFNSLVNISKKDVHPFSFFSKIVLSENTLSHPHLEMIVEHEKIHVKEKHTLDILFTEILFLLQWFNPFAWLLKDAVKNNLEYKTDHQIAKTTDPQTYQLAMLALADKQGVAPFLTALNGSQLKSRILMMKKKSRNKFGWLKQLVVLPVLAVLVMGLAEREVRTEVIQNDTQVTKSTTSKKDNDFLLSMHYQDNNMIINGLKGCAFKELTFTIEENASVAINQFGMYSAQSSKQQLNDSTLSDFLMVISRREKLTILTGNKGTNWKQLKFSNKTEAYVNKFGVRRQLEEPEIIRGNVINEKGEPFLGANIVEYDKLNRVISGTISNIKGQFVLELTPNKDSVTVKVQYPGYETKVIDITNNKLFHIQLEPKKEVENQKENPDNFDFSQLKIVVDGNEIPTDSPELKDIEITEENLHNSKYVTEIVDALNIDLDDIKRSTASNNPNNPFVYIRTKNYVPGTNKEFEEKMELDEFIKEKIKNQGNIAPGKNIQSEQVIGNIKWINNEIYTSSELTDALGINEGDKYSKEIIEAQVYGEVSNLYLDNGYLLFNATIAEKQKNDNSVDLEFTLYEGTLWKVGEIELKGNKSISTKEALNNILISSGDVFSRIKLIQSVENLNEIINKDTELVDVEVNPESVNPGNEFNNVNLVFNIKKNVEKINGIQLRNYDDPSKNPLFIVDGKIMENFEFDSINPDDIESVSVLKDKSATELYGEKGKNGVIVVTTKNSGIIQKGELPVVLNGKLTQLTLNEVDRDLIQNIKRIEPEEAVKKYGEKGENGVFEITSRNVYTDKVNVKSSEEITEEKITSELELRKFIAKEIIFPKEARDEVNSALHMSFYVHVNKKGEIEKIEENQRGSKTAIYIDEIVIVAERDKSKIPEADIKNGNLMAEEAVKAINKISVIEVDEFKGQVLKLNFKFVLQD